MTFDASLARRSGREKHEKWETKRKRRLANVKVVVRSYFERKGVKSVYVTGSLTRPDAYRPTSDIDLAVEGLPPEEYLTTLAELQELLGTDWVDLIELERCRFRSRIEAEGVRIL